MGLSCDSIQPKLDPEVEDLLNKVKDKAPDIIKNFVINEEKIKNEFTQLLEKRDKDVGEAKNKNEEELKKLLKKYNEKELDVEKEKISNEVEKMHCLWELGLELTEPLKNYTLKELQKKLDKAKGPFKKAVDSQINQVKAFSPKEFLNSPFGKPLKTALIKQGMSKTLLEDFKKQLLKDRKERRKKEKEKHPHVKNINLEEEDFEFNIDDLFEAIFDEYKDEFKSTIEKNLLKMIKK